MAIRSTNANRAAKAYNPTARPANGTGNFGRQNTDGPGNTPIDYGDGPPGRQSARERWDRRVEDYGMSPWYARGSQMPWAGPEVPGQRGPRAPMYTPDSGDPRNAGYFVPGPTPEEQEAELQARRDAMANLLSGDSAWEAARAAGDTRGMKVAEAMYRQRAEADHRARNGMGSPGGSPSRSQSSPPAYPPSAPAYPQSSSYPQSSAPQGNSMFQNYLGAVERPKANGGGASMSQYGGGGGTSARLDPSQFGGSSVNLDQLMGGGRNSMFEGYNPGQSKSGMGQSPMSGPAMSTGNPMGGMVDQSLRLGGGQVPPWARGQMPSGPVAEPAMVSGGGWWNQGGGYNPMAGGMDFGGQGYSAAGGIPPQFLQMLMGGGGGFNPSSMLGGGRSMGYNPYAMLGMF